jgi:hypothetical protein
MQESLVVTLELVVQHDPTDSPALIPESHLSALVSAIDLGIVRQLAWLRTQSGGSVARRFARSYRFSRRMPAVRSVEAITR